MERLGAAIREAEAIGLPWDADENGAKAKHLAKEASRRTLISPYAAGALRLLIFTGARLREILHLKWEEVDFKRGLAFLADSKTGRKPLVLSAPALAVLSKLHQIRIGPYVIAGDDPAGPRADLKRPWAAVPRRTKLEGVRIHDLRHTFASTGAGSSLGLPIIGKLLGPTQARTTYRYAHLDADPVQRAADLIGTKLAAALGDETQPEPQPNVISIGKSL